MIYEDVANIMEEAMQEAFNKPDWVLRDLPWMLPEYMTQITELIGVDNILTISGSMMPRRTEEGLVEMCRATVLISPQGITNVSTKSRADNDNVSSSTPEV